MAKQGMQHNALEQADQLLEGLKKVDSKVKAVWMKLWIVFSGGTNRPSPPHRGVSRSRVVVPEGAASGSIREELRSFRNRTQQISLWKKNGNTEKLFLFLSVAIDKGKKEKWKA